ncbi:hypothetical protein CSE16_15160 [Solibacillus sp. R5-41]|uniref:hypothetical protein n=1 Tax=Solibacillus sp. R5-41 TaxID=2048654 RepID=UPI000C1246E5|nr:hypothetical protein [Solibacillus sp. R5-41]ATP41287.1 hypothetical protein CSE16_15160 [Solibacillus sp. R5-41]
MKDISWEMDEYFFFPNHLGSVAEVQSLKISPQWVPVELDNSMRLNGIYHFAVEVAFNNTAEATLQKGAYIEELDFSDNVGYFEYALPFGIDLPDTAKQLDGVKVIIEGEQSAVFDGGCQVKWNVRCQYEDNVVEKIDNQEILVFKDENDELELKINTLSETLEASAIQETYEANVIHETPEVNKVPEIAEVKETVVLNVVNEVAESPKQLEEQLMYTVPSDDFYHELSEAYKVHQIVIPKARDNHK